MSNLKAKIKIPHKNKLKYPLNQSLFDRRLIGYASLYVMLLVAMGALFNLLGTRLLERIEPLKSFFTENLFTPVPFFVVACTLVSLSAMIQIIIYLLLKKKEFYSNKNSSQKSKRDNHANASIGLQKMGSPKFLSAYFYVTFLSARLIFFLVSMVVVRFTFAPYFYAYSFLLTWLALVSILLELLFILFNNNSIMKQSYEKP